MKAASRKEWQTYLSSLERTEGYPREPEGYLMALATCYKAYRREFSLPEAVLRDALSSPGHEETVSVDIIRPVRDEALALEPAPCLHKPFGDLAG